MVQTRGIIGIGVTAMGLVGLRIIRVTVAHKFSRSFFATPNFLIDDAQEESSNNQKVDIDEQIQELKENVIIAAKLNMSFMTEESAQNVNTKITEINDSVKADNYVADKTSRLKTVSDLTDCANIIAKDPNLPDLAKEPLLGIQERLEQCKNYINEHDVDYADIMDQTFDDIGGGE